MSQKRTFFGGFSLSGPKSKIKKVEEKKPLPPSALLSSEEFVKYKVPQPSDEQELKTEKMEESQLQQFQEENTKQEETEKEGKKEEKEEQEEDIDPLDAFMVGVHKEVEREKQAPSQPRLRRDDIEDEDDFDTFMKHKQKLEAKGELIQPRISSESADYDSDQEVYETAKAIDDNEQLSYNSDEEGRKKVIGPIAPLDHSSIQYEEFQKNFYEEHPDISGMSGQEVQSFRKELGINVSGYNVPKPCKTFEHFGFDEILLKEIKKQNYEEPTPIQKQAVPVVLSGRDIIGIAKTGSGKTAAFVWPMIFHMMDQRELEKGEGPIGIILAPTRELAHQIYQEARKFCKGYGIRCASIYGGISKQDQFKALKAGAEVVIATPGRLIDMIKQKGVKMNRVTYLVLDEADKMFDMGFEPQIRSIIGQIRPDRQTLLFSATFKKSVETLARDILNDPVRINIGNVGQANEDIRQVVHVFNDKNEKLPWLLKHLPSFVQDGSVIIFVSTKNGSEELAATLKNHSYHAAALHGDKDQNERIQIMFAFKNANLPILVATDVAARGLDVKLVKTVVNYEIARNVDAHTHRIGRTGRAGTKDGVAYTLITRSDSSHFAGELVRNLEVANQPVPPELVDLAMTNPKFRKTRQKLAKKGKGFGFGAIGSMGRGRGRGIGFTPSNQPPSFVPPTTSNARMGILDRSVQNIRAQFQNSFCSSSSNEEMNAQKDRITSKVPDLPPQPIPNHLVDRREREERRSRERSRYRDDRDYYRDRRDDRRDYYRDDRRDDRRDRRRY